MRFCSSKILTFFLSKLQSNIFPSLKVYSDGRFCKIIWSNTSHMLVVPCFLPGNSLLPTPGKQFHSWWISYANIPVLVQFFETIASKSASNLMDVTNLSIVIAPTLMPIHFSSAPKPRTSDRTDRQNCAKLHSYSKIIQLLIRNSTRLCGLPPFLATKLVCISTSSLTGTAGDIFGERGRRLSRDKKRHRRSSSFNRKMINCNLIFLQTG